MVTGCGLRGVRTGWVLRWGWGQVGALRGHGGTVTSVAFASDGKRLVTSSTDKTIKIWDAETWAEVHCCMGVR